MTFSLFSAYLQVVVPAPHGMRRGDGADGGDDGRSEKCWEEDEEEGKPD